MRTHGRDRRLLYATAFLRSFGTSLVGVLLGIYLLRLGFDPAKTGLLVAAGLAGGAVAALWVTLLGDRLGRRATLIVLALLGAIGTIGAVSSSRPGAMAAAAFLGMLNGMGRDRGASLVLEQAILPSTTGDRGRTMGFAWYGVVQDAGNALGALCAGAPVLLRSWLGTDDINSLRAVIAVNALCLLATAFLYLRMSPAAEAPAAPARRIANAAEASLAPGFPGSATPGAPRPSPRRRVSPGTRRTLWRISALFGVDSLAGGFLTTALLSYFFFERFGVAEGTMGLLFFGARAANAASHLGAAWLARRIGLVNTMVFTHIPSSLLLATVPFAPSFAVAAILFLLREGLVEMDVPTRQSYVMAVVLPEERTVASGVTNLVRLAGWAVAPAFAGLMMQGTSLAAPLFTGAGMKIGYDLLLYAAFRSRKPPEETANGPASTAPSLPAPSARGSRGRA